jgi:hypothetical protein
MYSIYKYDVFPLLHFHCQRYKMLTIKINYKKELFNNDFIEHLPPATIELT